MELEFSAQIFEKYANRKFNENPSSGSRVVQFGWTDRQTDIAKLMFAFHNFVYAPNITGTHYHVI